MSLKRSYVLGGSMSSSENSPTADTPGRGYWTSLPNTTGMGPPPNFAVLGEWVINHDEMPFDEGARGGWRVTGIFGNTTSTPKNAPNLYLYVPESNFYLAYSYWGWGIGPYVWVRTSTIWRNPNPLTDTGSPQTLQLLVQNDYPAGELSIGPVQWGYHHYAAG